METNYDKPNIEDLCAKYDYFWFDWDGVLYSGSHAIEGSVAALKYLKEHNKTCFFITNTSSRTQKGLKDKLQSLGIDISVDTQVKSEDSLNFTDSGIQRKSEDYWFSSSYTTGLYLNQEYPEIKKVFAIGEQGLVDQLAMCGIQAVGGQESKEIAMTPDEYNSYELDPDVGAVVVGYDADCNYRKIWIATLYLQNGRKFIACNDDMFDMIQGRPIPTTGVFLKTLEYTTGIKPYVCGKPNPHIFKLISKNFGIQDKEHSVIMIGDRLTTDIEMAHNAGISSCLVLTGCNTEEDIQNVEENPNGIIPTHVMPRLGFFNVKHLKATSNAKM